MEPVFAEGTCRGWGGGSLTSHDDHYGPAPCTFATLRPEGACVEVEEGG